MSLQDFAKSYPNLQLEKVMNAKGIDSKYFQTLVVGQPEFLAGAEWDITKKLQVSGGAQLTRYGLSDAYMNDMSFVVNSWTFGLGVGYQVSDKVKLNAAYFQTNYENYDMDTPEKSMPALDLTIPAGKNSFTRTNRVIGVGVEVTL